MVKVPVRPPKALGVKETEIVQLLFAARVLGDIGQLEVQEKSPDDEIFEIASDAV
jgi:hypothetical protein